MATEAFVRCRRKRGSLRYADRDALKREIKREPLSRELARSSERGTRGITRSLPAGATT
jgi:hypothetical protein